LFINGGERRYNYARASGEDGAKGCRKEKEDGNEEPSLVADKIIGLAY
jgi:hypothetical protein